MNIFIILILITIIYCFITVRYFNFFSKSSNIIYLIISFLIFNLLIQSQVIGQVNLLALILQLSIFVSFRIHSNIFYLESPTLFLSNIIYSLNISSKTKLKQLFLKHKFFDYYIQLLIKQKMIEKKKNYFYLKKNGKIFFKFYEILFNILIK